MPYNGTISVSGGKAPYVFSLSSGSLPAGLSLSTATGTISGTPGKTGLFSFAVQALDSTGIQAAQAFQITVTTPGTIAVTVTPTIATLPSSGTMQFTALVSRHLKRSSHMVRVPRNHFQHRLSIRRPLLPPTPRPLSPRPAAQIQPSSEEPCSRSRLPPEIHSESLQIRYQLPAIGVPYSATLKATGGTLPYNWTLASGTLPSGLTLQSNGLISGSTSQTGQFNFTLEVDDSSSRRQTATKSLSLTVSSSAGNGNNAPSTLFGFTATNTGVRAYPTVSYGMQRFWDSPPLQWPSINTASGVFDFSNLDATLATAYSSGVMQGMYTLARTPPWATSKPSGFILPLLHRHFRRRLRRMRCAD